MHRFREVTVLSWPGVLVRHEAKERAQKAVRGRSPVFGRGDGRMSSAARQRHVQSRGSNDPCRVQPAAENAGRNLSLRHRGHTVARPEPGRARVLLPPHGERRHRVHLPGRAHRHRPLADLRRLDRVPGDTDLSAPDETRLGLLLQTGGRPVARLRSILLSVRLGHAPRGAGAAKSPRRFPWPSGRTWPIG